MPWHPSLNQLRDALAELYPDVADARRVAASASLPLGRVALQGKPVNDWQSILEEAIKQDCVDAIIAVAAAEYGRNPALLAAAVAHYQKVATERSTLPVSPATATAGPLVLNLGSGVTLELVRVPAGEFLMGRANTDPLAEDDEKPQHKLWLPEYLIGKYPVTVAQYRAFVQATGYTTVVPNVTEWPDNHPVVNISWFEALAFCDWANHVSGRLVQLPSEAEWEKAARGTDGRIYPWGNRFDPGRCNSQERGPNRTTPIGHYSPLGDSPYGCADMAGNVSEWTRSLWGKHGVEREFRYPYDPRDGRENTNAADDILRVMRGGAFYIDGTHIHCAHRVGIESSYHNVDGGFRVVVVTISP